MSLLSGDKFASGSSGGSNLPKQVRISRVLLWVQAAIGLLLSAFILLGTYQQSQLSNTELSKLLKERLTAKVYNKQFKDDPPTQDLFNYPLLYLLAALLVVLMIVLIYCALKLKFRQKPVRLVTVIAEGLLIPFSLWELSTIGCALILPAMAVIVMLLSRQTKEWYDTAAAE